MAEHPEFGRILIEAKGETSAHKTSKRDGRAFDSAQVRNHVAKAIYTALRLHGTGDRVAIAFPDSALHRKRLEEVNSVLTALGIQTYLVAANRAISRL